MSSVFERLRTLALSRKPDSKSKVSRARSVGQPQRQSRIKYPIGSQRKKSSSRPCAKRCISKNLMRKISKNSRDSLSRKSSRLSLKLAQLARRKTGTFIKTVDDWIVDSGSSVLPLFLAKRSVRQDSTDSYYSSDGEASAIPSTSNFSSGKQNAPSIKAIVAESDNIWGLNFKMLESPDILLIDEHKKSYKQLSAVAEVLSDQSLEVVSSSIPFKQNGSSKSNFMGSNSLIIDKMRSAPLLNNNYEVKNEVPILKSSSVIKFSSLAKEPSSSNSLNGQLRLELTAPDFEFGSEKEQGDSVEDEAKVFEDFLFNQKDWVQPEDLCPILSLGSLGRGAGGDVSGVFHIPSCSIFALKETSYESEIQTFVIMKEALGDKETPQLMCLHGLFQDDNSNEIALVLEYMNLGSLHDHFTSKGVRCTENQIRHIARETLLGLKALHELDIPIIHRDIKPRNILLDTEGSIRVADYGLLYCLVDEKQQCVDPAGTSKYFSPERHRGKFSTPSDIWALGVTLVECCLGRLIEPKDLEDVKVAEGHVNPMDFLCEIELPLQAVNFLKCCLQAKAEKRWSASLLLAHPFLEPPYPDHRQIFKSSNIVEGDEKLLEELVDTIQNFILVKVQEDVKIDIWGKSGITHEQRLANICRWTGFTRAHVENYIMYLYNVRTRPRSRVSYFK